MLATCGASSQGGAWSVRRDMGLPPSAGMPGRSQRRLLVRQAAGMPQPQPIATIACSSCRPASLLHLFSTPAQALVLAATLTWTFALAGTLLSLLLSVQSSHHAHELPWQ
jgi:hypothetical protein